MEFLTCDSRSVASFIVCVNGTTWGYSMHKRYDCMLALCHVSVSLSKETQGGCIVLRCSWLNSLPNSVNHGEIGGKHMPSTSIY